MELPKEVRKMIRELIEETRFGSPECKASVSAHIGAYVVVELLEAQLSHVQDTSIDEAMKCRNVGELLNQILGNDSVMLSLVLRRALDKCLEAEKSSPASKLAIGGESKETPQKQPSMLKDFFRAALMTLASPTGVKIIAIALAAGITVSGTLSPDQLETLRKFFLK